MKLSVLVITYNHEKFIAQALESVLMQEVAFDYEIVIGEDCSTDTTRNIVIDYQKRYPEKIRLLLPENNRGMMLNFVDTYKACQGEYIALLEGDDYWTSRHKLQKQVEFLDSNHDFTICFHWADWLEHDSIREKSFGPPVIKEFYTLDDLLKYNNFLPTSSVVFRRDLFGEFPDWYMGCPAGDYPLHVMNAQYGKIGIIDESMAVYRRHEGGIHGGKSYITNIENALKVYSIIGGNIGCKKNSSFKNTVNTLFHELLAEQLKHKDYNNIYNTIKSQIKFSPANVLYVVKILLTYYCKRSY